MSARRLSPWPWARPCPVSLAPGEEIVWQGGPAWRNVAVRLYHVRLVGLYCLALMIADLVQARMHGLPPLEVAQAALPGALTALGAVGIFAGFAWGSARTTVYTVTTERVVMQCGLALPATINIPLHRIAGVAVRVRADGSGDVTIRPHAGAKLAFVKLWPFARPWRFATPEPMLRDAPAAGYVGSALSRMVAAAQVRAVNAGLKVPAAAPAVRRPALAE